MKSPLLLLTLLTWSAGGAALAQTRPDIQTPDSLTAEAARTNATNACRNATADFNACVVATTQFIYADRRNKGYDTHGIFTKALDYGPATAAITPSDKKPETMCVAAASEMAIETLNSYYKATNDARPFNIIKSSSWNGSGPTDIRSFMWENEGPADSRGAGRAFVTFGAGEIVDFSAAKPGDFLSLDRQLFRPRVTWTAQEARDFARRRPETENGQIGAWKYSGHSTVFLGYLDKSLNWTSRYQQDVVGFLYFSSQGGHGADGGFNYRWAIFKGSKDRNNRDICGVMPSLSAKIDCHFGGIERKVRVGRLWHPSRWNAARPAQFQQEVAQQLRTSYQALVSRDLTTLKSNTLIPDIRLNLPGMKEFSQQQPNRAAVNNFVELRVQAELAKQNPYFDEERFDGNTDP